MSNVVTGMVAFFLSTETKGSQQNVTSCIYEENNNINSNKVVLLMQSDLSLEKIVNVK